MKELFDNPEDLHDDLSTSQAEVADLARRISNRIDRIVAVNNRVSFTLGREAAIQVHELAELEGCSIATMCSRIIEEYLAE